ncbi:MAG: methyltransferase domain-containing protein [Chloroflexota bacterium]
MTLRSFFNAKAATWDERVAEKDTGKLLAMSRRLDIRPGTCLLDVGTGTGVFLPYLLASVGNEGRIVALDLAEEMLKVAREKSYTGNIEYLCADVQAVPCGDGIFDGVVCYSSFPHFQDKTRALAEIFRVLKGGGGLFVCHTSPREEINHRHLSMPEVRHDLIPGEEEMRALLRGAGFTAVNIEDGAESYLATARKPAPDS